MSARPGHCAETESFMATDNTWRSWSLSTKLTVGIGTALAVVLVLVLNFA